MTPDDSARNRKMRKMMSRNCSICLMPIFGVGKVYRIWTPKGGPPQYHERINGLKAVMTNNPEPGIFFRLKSIDYRDEVTISQRFSWRSISPALPEVRDVNCMPLEP